MDILLSSFIYSFFLSFPHFLFPNSPLVDFQSLFMLLMLGLLILFSFILGFYLLDFQATPSMFSSLFIFGFLVASSDCWRKCWINWWFRDSADSMRWWIPIWSIFRVCFCSLMPHRGITVEKAEKILMQTIIECERVLSTDRTPNRISSMFVIRGWSICKDGELDSSRLILILHSQLIPWWDAFW